MISYGDCDSYIYNDFREQLVNISKQRQSLKICDVGGGSTPCFTNYALLHLRKPV